MNKNELNSKWENIASFKNKKGYKALRITAVSIPDLFLATDEDGHRCLLLFLPKKVDVKLKGVDKSKLLISFLPSKGIVLIKLKDFDFKDLFDDLILSIYSKINLISKPVQASEEFIKTFYKWALFFEDKKVKKLGEELIQGLFGELFVLSQYLNESNPSNINSILDSWRGLYDAANDFEFDLKNIEVKTKKESTRFVKISSEYQLEKVLDKDLELVVVSVKLDLIEGKSIHDMLLEIVKQVRENLGDLSILYQALNQKGLTLENLKQYNNYRFIVTKTESLNAGHDDFPKLSISNIVSEVSNLKYMLRVTQLNQFLIESKKY
ncbi:PD-(D/E)XK motif protein [Neotamlana laminarinivorans]|uniref:PD-(D/E)XK motif protein n=1 Tax=Neotamlana laminarinivorans TaxID=2883124 RepID=A0A9X1I3K8_9FLAO|nr:PD-(D/E)XK motif protein [Tamlana laminarinivorans]MCB4800028.1 PD-(D/E)XK motif protein [Tamlana laminarinivorans]